MTLSELPIFDQVLTDGKLPPRQLQLWRVLTKHLDVVVARKIPTEDVMRELAIEDSSSVRKLTAGLLQRGYLVRENGLYRVPLSRASVGSDVLDDEDDESQVEAPKARTPRRRINSPGVV